MSGYNGAKLNREAASDMSKISLLGESTFTFDITCENVVPLIQLNVRAGYFKTHSCCALMRLAAAPYLFSLSDEKLSS